MKRVYLFISILCFSQFGKVAAQTTSLVERKNYRFQSILQLGVLEGSANSAFVLQTVNGLQHGSWFAGVGTGIDYYRFRSIPLFIDIRKRLIKERPLYLYADGGVHFPWLKDGESEWFNSTFESGGYFDAGISYGFPIKKSTLLISAGYSFKALSEVVRYTNPCLVGPCPEFKETYEYNLKRIAIKAGWQF